MKTKSTLGNRKIGELFGVTSGAVTKAALRAKKDWLADGKTRKKAERIANSIFGA
ncbi:MAG: hypothetical protein RDV41_14590 [Planctomycetota bacterium]|nr:hypothetical protein [Planctomycetota bacterium]